MMTSTTETKEVPATSCLLYRGGRTIPRLSFKTFYFGSIWRQDPSSALVNRHASARIEIDRAIAAAMTDKNLNAVLSQYLRNQPVGSTALPSDIVDDVVRVASPNIPFNEIDIRRVINDLLLTRLAGLDLATTAINIVLPQGMSLEILGLDEQERPVDAVVMDGVPRDTPNYSSGIAGYHGSVETSVAGKSVEVLYSVVVWSDGSIGIPVRGWHGWENIAATLYHELQEIRTNPDVDRAVRTGDSRYVGWNTAPIDGPDGLDCREIADLPLLLNSDRPYDAFGLVPVTDHYGSSTKVPIQLMWSNADGRMMPDVSTVSRVGV